jgi:hypothetical protein
VFAHEKSAKLRNVLSLPDASKLLGNMMMMMMKSQQTAVPVQLWQPKSRPPTSIRCSWGAACWHCSS